MTDRLIDWNSPGNYDPLWVTIGLVLFCLLFADFIWIYLKNTKKEKENDRLDKKNNHYENKRIWQSPRFGNML